MQQVATRAAAPEAADRPGPSDRRRPGHRGTAGCSGLPAGPSREGPRAPTARAPRQTGSGWPGSPAATLETTLAKTSQKAVGTWCAIWLPYPLSVYLSWGVPSASCTPVMIETRNAGASAPRSTGSGSLDTWIPSRSGTSICHHHVPLASESRCSMRMVRSGASSPRGADSVASGGASIGPSAASRSSVSTTMIVRVASPIACPPTAYSALTERLRMGRSVGMGRSVRLTDGYGVRSGHPQPDEPGSSPPSTRSNPSASSWMVRS